MNTKTFYIDIDRSRFLSEQGGILTEWPTIAYGACPTWTLRFVRPDTLGNLQPIDVSEAVSWHAAIDTDFNRATLPMVRTLDDDIDKSAVASGILQVPLNANNTSFQEKIGTRNSIQAYFEVRGYDPSGYVIYDYRMNMYALGAVDPEGSEPIELPSGYATQDWTRALLRAAPEFQFSEDGISDWHETRDIEDDYFRVRNPEGQWSEAILIVNGIPPSLSSYATIDYVDYVSGWLYSNLSGETADPNALTGVTLNGTLGTVSNKVASLTLDTSSFATTSSLETVSGNLHDEITAIPTANNGVLTITQGGTTKGTFSANASENVTIELDAGGGGGGGSDPNALTGVTLNGVAGTVTDKVAALNVSIPTVGNGTLTIKQNGSSVGTFSANASSDVEINLIGGGGGGGDGTDYLLREATKRYFAPAVRASGEFNDMGYDWVTSGIVGTFPMMLRSLDDYETLGMWRNSYSNFLTEEYKNYGAWPVWDASKRTYKLPPQAQKQAIAKSLGHIFKRFAVPIYDEGIEYTWLPCGVFGNDEYGEQRTVVNYSPFQPYYGFQIKYIGSLDSDGPKLDDWYYWPSSHESNEADNFNINALMKGGYGNVTSGLPPGFVPSSIYWLYSHGKIDTNALSTMYFYNAGNTGSHNSPQWPKGDVLSVEYKPEDDIFIVRPYDNLQALEEMLPYEDNDWIYYDGHIYFGTLSATNPSGIYVTMAQGAFWGGTDVYYTPTLYSLTTGQGQHSGEYPDSMAEISGYNWWWNSYKAVDVSPWLLTGEIVPVISTYVKQTVQGISEFLSSMVVNTPAIGTASAMFEDVILTGKANSALTFGLSGFVKNADSLYSLWPTVEAADLPSGLSFVPISSFTNLPMSYTECLISGRPTEVCSGNIKITVKAPYNLINDVYLSYDITSGGGIAFSGSFHEDLTLNYEGTFEPTSETITFNEWVNGATSTRTVNLLSGSIHVTGYRRNWDTWEEEEVDEYQTMWMTPCYGMGTSYFWELETDEDREAAIQEGMDPYYDWGIDTNKPTQMPGVEYVMGYFGEHAYTLGDLSSANSMSSESAGYWDNVSIVV